MVKRLFFLAPAWCAWSGMAIIKGLKHSNLSVRHMGCNGMDPWTTWLLEHRWAVRNTKGQKSIVKSGQFRTLAMFFIFFPTVIKLTFLKFLYWEVTRFCLSLCGFKVIAFLENHIKSTLSSQLFISFQQMTLHQLWSMASIQNFLADILYKIQ